VSSKEEKRKEGEEKKKEGKLTVEKEKICVYVSVCVFVFVIGTVRNQCQC
jgi:hypothetical protein